MRAELLLSVLERRSGRPDEAASSASYLQQRVEFGQGGDGAAVLMDSENAVMMAWEGMRPAWRASPLQDLVRHPLLCKNKNKKKEPEKRNKELDNGECSPLRLKSRAAKCISPHSTVSCLWTGA